MSVKLKDFISKVTGFFKKKKTKPLVFIAVAGIVFIGLSEITFGNKSSKKETEKENISVNEYIENLEKRTVEMVSSVDGAGESRVMITADASVCREYAVNENKTEEIQNSSGQSREKSDEETEIVIVRPSGDDEALVTRINEPSIRGVLVLCEGADNPEINERVTQAVKTVLGVSANKICVIKIKQ